mmetsp:Transcript_5913/g.9178  ORF Transcript_5913/g.9178 Transcript_5913/m.9178 type:complete len:173 (-) Transcript_5913:54-572(-)
MASFVPLVTCRECGVGAKPGEKLLRCAACKCVFYCTREHQKKDWRTHKQTCSLLKTAIAADGWTKSVIQEGEGKNPETRNLCTLHYTGRLPNGLKFDSSRDRDKPFQFHLATGQVISSWDECVASMRKGEKCVMACSPRLGYGSRGSPPAIPPNSPLIFEMELIDFEKPTGI